MCEQVQNRSVLANLGRVRPPPKYWRMSSPRTTLIRHSQTVCFATCLRSFKKKMSATTLPTEDLAFRLVEDDWTERIFGHNLTR